MYLAAPINQIYQPQLNIEAGFARVEMDLQDTFHHAGRATHGSVYFKMLDDAAFFAVGSLEPEYFVLTSSFVTYLTRPIAEGRMIAEGKVVSRTRTQFIAEAVVRDERERELARGNGVFVRGKGLWREAMGYQAP